MNPLLALLASTLVAAPAFAATSVQPGVGAPACFKREYSDEHMSRHPQQKLSSLFVMVTRDKWKGESPDPELASPGADVVGEKDGVYYANPDAGCEYKANGATRCAVECDGGAFDLKDRSDNVLFSVAKDYYFPLFREGTTAETAGKEDELQLEASDKENAHYKLYQVPARECEAAIRRAKIGEWGC